MPEPDLMVITPAHLARIQDENDRLAAELVRERRNMTDLGDAKRVLERLCRKHQAEIADLRAEKDRLYKAVVFARSNLDAGLDPHATVAQTVTCARAALDALAEALTGQEGLFYA